MGSAVLELDGVTSIAVIDDAFAALSDAKLPPQENDAVVALLAGLSDPEVLEDFAQCGVDGQMLRQQPYSAVDALTDPGRILGIAYVALSQVSETLAKWIDDRHTMRGIAEAMRHAAGCEVVELTPDDDLDVQDKDTRIY